MRRSRAAAIGALCALLVASCAKGEPAGVRVKGVDADLVFGVEEPPKDATPPNAIGSDGIDPGYLTGNVALPDQTFATTKRPPRVVATPNRAPCPSASGSAVVKEPSPDTVPEDRRPAPGIYRWKKAGTANESGFGNIAITGFEQRVIRNVKDIGKSSNTAGLPGSTARPATIFQYETVQPDISGNVVTSTYRIDPYAQSTTSYAPVGQLQVRAGPDPERGIVLKGFDVADSAGRPVSGFHPVSGLLLLPLPVVDGDSWTSVAVDPTTGQEAVFQGKVLPRRDIDACGELVQGWVVQGTQTFSGGTRRSYEAVFAPQLGGLLLYEKVDEENAATKASVHLESTIGQLTPDPLPAG
jgi:hypothetical protein